MAAFLLEATVKPTYAEVKFGVPSAPMIALEAAVDAALEQEDIAASEDAVAAVEAIRTAVTQALEAQASDVALMIDNATVSDMNALKRGVDAILRTVEGSNLFSVPDEEE
jgi:thiazole synthase ThiGH ThiG subunit